MKGGGCPWKSIGFLSIWAKVALNMCVFEAFQAPFVGVFACFEGLWDPFKSH